MQSPLAVAVLRGIDVRLRRAEEGQDLVEYALLAALIAVVAIGAVSAAGNAIYQVFWRTIASNF